MRALLRDRIACCGLLHRVTAAKEGKDVVVVVPRLWIALQVAMLGVQFEQLDEQVLPWIEKALGWESKYKPKTLLPRVSEGFKETLLGLFWQVAGGSLVVGPIARVPKVYEYWRVGQVRQRVARSMAVQFFESVAR